MASERIETPKWRAGVLGVGALFLVIMLTAGATLFVRALFPSHPRARPLIASRDFLEQIVAPAWHEEPSALLDAIDRRAMREWGFELRADTPDPPRDAIARVAVVVIDGKTHAVLAAPIEQRFSSWVMTRELAAADAPACESISREDIARLLGAHHSIRAGWLCDAPHSSTTP